MYEKIMKNAFPDAKSNYFLLTNSYLSNEKFGLK